MIQPTIAPSDQSPWLGTPVSGSDFTAQQLATMNAERPGWTGYAVHLVQLTYPSALQWGEPTIGYATCPILAYSRDKTRRLIVRPDGGKQWVSAATDQTGRISSQLPHSKG
jgi:hypothetical protein